MTALRAMAYGQALVASDGWAIDDYLGDGEAAIVVPGRAGQCWRYDAEIGFFREKWRPLSDIDPDYVMRLITAIEGLIAEPARLAATGRAGRKAVESHHTIDSRNAGFKRALDAAIGRADGMKISGAPV